MVYPRFQPASLPGFANHAHMDYIEMLFEGGIFFVLLAAAFLWLAGGRALRLLAAALRERTLDREAMAAALCGLGLLGLLLHSLVDFNLRIPANAILGALLAGAFFRPLPLTDRAGD
jgi:O-antigen ligase